MKIRIKGNSVRFRLSITDVARFNRDGYIEEVTDFGRSQLTYALQKGPAPKLEAEFRNNKIILFMPYADAGEWASTDKVSLEHTAGGLHLLIEKDFKCIDNTSEDQSDNFPNPHVSC